MDKIIEVQIFVNGEDDEAVDGPSSSFEDTHQFELQKPEPETLRSLKQEAINTYELLNPGYKIKTTSVFISYEDVHPLMKVRVSEWEKIDESSTSHS